MHVEARIPGKHRTKPILNNLLLEPAPEGMGVGGSGVILAS